VGFYILYNEEDNGGAGCSPQTSHICTLAALF